MQAAAASTVDAAQYALRRKAARSEATFFLLAQLQKLNPYESEYFLPDLLAIFFSADVTLFGKVSDWLSAVHGALEAQRVVSHAIASWEGLPLEFERTASHGTIVACRCGAPKDAAADDVDSDEDDVDAYGNSSSSGGKKKKAAAMKFIEEVSAVTDNANAPMLKGTIMATVREGDLVKLNSHSRLWWTVFEMRAAKGTVLLCNKEARVQSAGGKREAKTEYKEVRLALLLGCLVRREGVLSPRTMDQVQRNPGRELEFQDRLITCAKDAEKEGFVGPSAEAYTSEGCRRVTVLFQIPGPDLRVSVARMRALVAEFPKPEDMVLTPSSSANKPPVDPVQHMQYQAQAKAWVARWEESQRARQILIKIDPFGCVLSRDKWLLAARALKTISRGGLELFQDFVELTRGAGREGQLRAKDCRVAWECLRPVTSADLPALSKARAYLKMRGAGRDQAFFDENGRLRPEAMHVDATSRGILEAASTYLADRNLVFLDQAPLGSTKVAADVAMHLDEAAFPVASATYDHYLVGSDAGAKADVRNVYIGVETARAYLTAGDAMLIRGTLGAEAQAQAGTGASKNQTWVQIISVDLLFARLRVVPCSAPPPLCWYLPSHRPEALSHEGSADTPALWLPLSRIWDATVCRLLPMSDPSDAEARRGRHLIFVTPMPSPAEALAVLAAFDRKPDSEAAAPGSGPEQAQQRGGGSLGRKSSLLLASTKQKPRRSSTPGGLPETVRSSQERGGGRFSVAALGFFTDAVIVAWSAVKVVPRPFINVRGELVTPTAQDCQVHYDLEIAHTSKPYEWLHVYGGNGLGCQVSGLEPLNQYYCRVTASASLPQTFEFRRGGRPDEIEKAQELERRRAQTVVTTLSLAVSVAPTIGRWEASASGSARGLVTVFTKDAFFVPDLPAECFFQIEASLGPPPPAQSNNKSDEDELDNNWFAVGRTRSPQCWVVGPFAGRTILLRSRVVNMIAQPGPASPVAIISVPELVSDKKSARSGGGLNESAISELTR